MSGPIQCAAVIPCLNEAATIEQVVCRVGRFVDKVFVVDDGSADGTSGAAETAGAVVMRHPERRGKGAALQTGCSAARQAGYKHAVILDGDGQHAAEDIPRFIRCAEESGASLVVGNRMHDPQTMPLARRFVNWWMSRRLSKLAGLWLPDTQCGFRLMSLEAWSHLAIKTTRFEVDSEILLSFARAGHAIRFVPVQVIYGTERSKINPMKDAWRWFRWFRRARRETAGS